MLSFNKYSFFTDIIKDHDGQLHMALGISIADRRVPHHDKLLRRAGEVADLELEWERTHPHLLQSAPPSPLLPLELCSHGVFHASAVNPLRHVLILIIPLLFLFAGDRRRRRCLQSRPPLECGRQGTWLRLPLLPSFPPLHVPHSLPPRGPVRTPSCRATPRRPPCSPSLFLGDSWVPAPRLRLFEWFLLHPCRNTQPPAVLCSACLKSRALGFSISRISSI